MAKSYDSMKPGNRDTSRAEGDKEIFTAQLGPYQAVVEKGLAEISSQEIVRRIWAHDYKVWSSSPEEITNRLGWLHSPEVMVEGIGRIQDLAQSVKAEGYTYVLLLGMGGSSLAPEVFSNVFGHDHKGLELSILDSTDPGAVMTYTDRLDPAKTLFIVATKSGGTVETISFFKHFYNRTAEALGQKGLGAKEVGAHFVAITDKGSKLEKIAQQYNFRATFLNDPNIGGRYSALSYFGLVAAGLVGVDLDLLLDRARIMADYNKIDSSQEDDDTPGGLLGVILGDLARLGRDKVTLVASPALANFGDWIEQLIAESTGKDGKGILPVVGEELGRPEVYGQDRLFVHLRLDGDGNLDRDLEALVAAGHPVITIHLLDRYDLGQQFFLWEMATAVAGNRLGIQPFNQPNVESAKVLARQMVQRYQEEGTLPSGDAAPVTVETLTGFLDQARAGDYLSLQAYVQQAPAVDRALTKLRLIVRDKMRLATTVGYGPRFLHSTGQLHKGDGGNGLFIQFISQSTVDIPIPDEAGSSESSITFGVLKAAQALGDAQALLDAGRRVIRFPLHGDVAGSIQALADGLTHV